MFKHGPAGLQVPAAEMEVVAKTEQARAVGRERERGRDGLPMTGQAIDLAAVLNREQPYRVIQADGQQVTVRREGEVADFLIEVKHPALLARGGVPETHAAVV